MKSGRLNPWDRLLGLVLFCLLLAASGQDATQAAAISPAPGSPSKQHPRLVGQNDGYDWSGNWTTYGVLSSGRVVEDALTITGGPGGAYTATTYLCEIAYYPTDIEVDDTGTRSFWAEGYVFRIHTETFYNGIHAHTCDVFLNRTTHPDQLAGMMVATFTHEVTTGDWPPRVVPLSSPAVYEEPLCAARNGAGMPEPCGAEPTNGLVPVSGGANTAPQGAPTSLPPPEAQDPQPDPPPVQGSGPAPELVAPSPADSSLLGDRVSPLGQAAAAAATTLLLAIWLALEAQGSAAGSAGAQPVSSSSSDLVLTILDETNHLTPQDAGDWLAANTSGLLDSLDRPPAAATASQPSAPANPPQAGPAATPGGGPSSAYNGPVAGVQTEVFGDRDAYLIMQALQLVPTEWLPGDHLMEVDPFNLDPLLGGHSDGRPHRVVLENRRELFVHSVQGVAFDDRRRDEATDFSTIDFTNGFAIAVDVVIPGPAAPTPGTPGSAGGQAGQAPGSGGQPGSQGQPGPGQEGAQTPGGGPEGGAAAEGTPDGSSAVQETGGSQADQAGTAEDSPTRTPEEDQAELDRFYGDEPGSGWQGQGSYGRTSGGIGSQGLEGDPGGEEVQLDEVDEGDLSGDEADEDTDAGEGVPEREGRRPGPGDPELNARVDALLDEIKAGMLQRREPPAPEGGEGLGGNQAGIVDDDDIDSATGTL